ncbi:lipoyltransferase [Histoplasma capsulatum]|uniref:Putative lipoate-protein ligase A n=1 Tax=Ajellomyces capsulatus TaxID=5037 RepID=A0A8A1MAX8_AJECA|nr:lipoyltransferase [Histoplasma capsulatum]
MARNQSSRAGSWAPEHCGWIYEQRTLCNLNYCVICPKPVFHRDKHAEMVVRALQRVGAVNTRVNERHDIVLGQDPGTLSREAVKVETGHPKSLRTEKTIPHSLKISGSAYKLTRFRALHHGTCLIDSPNLGNITSFLRSPARPYLKAKGVDSVRSPVGNVSSVVDSTFLMDQVISNIMEEFAQLYGMHPDAILRAQRAHAIDPEVHMAQNWAVGGLADSHALALTNTHAPAQTRVFLRVKSGAIISSQISTSANPEQADVQSERTSQILANRKLHEISDWAGVIAGSGAFDSQDEIRNVSSWLASKLGR